MDRILVTPEVLETTAGEFSNIGNQVSQLAVFMTEKVTGLNGVWQGEAATEYSNKFMALSDDINKLNGMIQEHSSDLMEMAAAYKSAESQNLSTAQTLAGDVIS